MKGSADPAALHAKLEAAAIASPEDAIAACEGVLVQLEGADTTVGTTRLVLARALFEKARALSRLGRSRESQIVVAELVRRSEHDSEPEARRLVCRALFGQSRDRLAEQNADRRQIITEYRHILHIAERAPALDHVAVEALYHIALTHGKIALERSNAEHRERAEQRFVEVKQRFGESADPAIVYWLERCNDAQTILGATATADT
ncbi:hypothetical protein AKJ09_04386 [Labilithrix luteola]|uniref:Uncharacterized protein n=1 Tax=Labilithrix luteola TaxID=1391654 RepID=A0A0K1PW33_9BACT|nr:hypothetical protein [Labilithrix luteola]AKU97722.1 hypothetical protein AKJ09_04386 [Labilithrix luteola]